MLGNSLLLDNDSNSCNGRFTGSVWAYGSQSKTLLRKIQLAEFLKSDDTSLSDGVLKGLYSPKAPPQKFLEIFSTKGS